MRKSRQPFRAIEAMSKQLDHDQGIRFVDFATQAPAYHLSQAELAIFRMKEGTITTEEAVIMAAKHLLCAYETEYILARKTSEAISPNQGGETDGK